MYIMGDLTAGIDSYFWLTGAGIVFGSLGLLIRYSYKSKCKSVKVCCIKIVRDIESEEREDMAEMKQSTPTERKSLSIVT